MKTISKDLINHTFKIVTTTLFVICIVIVIYNRKIVNEILTLIHEYLKGVKFDITQGIELR